MQNSFLPFFRQLTLSVLVGALLFVASCRKDDNDNDYDQRVVDNTTFLDLMKDWYFWYDKMPDIDPSVYQSPYRVLEAVRYSKDPWSFVTTREEFESYYRDSKFIGHGFGSGWDAQDNLRVTFVFENTALFEFGVRRSWIIERINDRQISRNTNINELLGPNDVGITNSFRFISPGNDIVDVTDEKKEIIMNSVLHKEVFEHGGRKTGYIVYKGFTGPSRDEADTVFSYFLEEGIDNLILDLRYNSGGQTDVANYIASTIGGSSVIDQSFTEYVYNDQQSESNFIDSFKVPDYPLNIEELVVISTRSTASASEMVINGLKPYLPVVVVGNNTSGKPMGMNSWYYREYAFVPITFKIVNANGEGEYFDGLPADGYVDDDLSRMFGDPEELSLREALNYIETGTFSLSPATKMLDFYHQPMLQMRGMRRIIGAH